MAISDVQARLKPEFKVRYPHLNASIWYDVIPLFPGVTERRVNLSGDRLTRIRGPRDFETLKAGCFEFRKRPHLEGVTARV